MKFNPLMLVAVSATAALGCIGLDESEETSDSEEVSSVQQREILACANVNPSVPPSAIKFDREMVINNVKIVDDPCRTKWTTGAASGCGTSWGAWTFGRLMTTMSGATDVASSTATQFVAKWLKTWMTIQTPTANDSPSVNSRPSIQEALIGPWLADSSCPPNATLDTCALDLKKAPFRLLAIVNRIDMSGSAQYGAAQSPGEFRLVFGALGKDVQAGINSGATLQSTVILEYKFPSTRSALSWANLLHQLSAIDPSTSTPLFAQTLQSVSDLIIGPGAQPGAANAGSSIGQVRTNEIVYDFNMGSGPTGNFAGVDPSLANWEMRQFKLASTSGTGVQLIQAPVDQTPPTSANNSSPLKNFVIANRTALLSGSAVLPTTLIGGSSLSPLGINAIVWMSPNPLTAGTAPELNNNSRALARHNFGFATCNGCHYAETANQNGLFHIAPREDSTESTLSSFLTAGGGMDPLATSNNSTPINQVKVTDPTGLGVPTPYNEPWRRACEIRRILAGATVALSTATGHVSVP
jgi:hypothetical protein